MKNAVLMARVSSDEQARGYSLGIQTDSLNRYCERNALTVVKAYKEDHSAKNFKRPEWKNFLAFLKANKGKVDIVLVTTWDRFSRNLTDALIEMRKLRALGVEVMAIEQPIDLSIPENKAMLAIFLALPEIDNDRRSMKITEGMRAALKAGRWCRNAPIGYANRRDHDNKPIIVASDKAPFIRFAFMRILKGDQQAEIRVKLREKGCDIPRTALSKILKNPVYIGKIKVGKTDEEPERVVEGLHDGLVTEQDFNAVQKILGACPTQKNRPKRNSIHENLPLRGVLACSVCGGKMTGSGSRSKTGKRHFYYHCNHCNNERFPVGIVNETVEGMMREFRLTKTVKELLKQLLKHSATQTGAQSKISRTKLQKQLLAKQGRLAKLQDMFLDGNVSKTDYESMRARCAEQIQEAQDKLTEIAPNGTQANDQLRTVLKKIGRLDLLYKAGTAREKQRILSSIFPEMFVFDGKKCRTQHFNKALARILLVDNRLGEVKTGQLPKYLEVSRLVEPEGFEPSSKQGNSKLSTCVFAH
jgi:site-specific DNA recombinase